MGFREGERESKSEREVISRNVPLSADLCTTAWARRSWCATGGESMVRSSWSLFSNLQILLVFAPTDSESVPKWSVLSVQVDCIPIVDIVRIFNIPCKAPPISWDSRQEASSILLLVIVVVLYTAWMLSPRLWHIGAWHLKKLLKNKSDTFREKKAFEQKRQAKPVTKPGTVGKGGIVCPDSEVFV